MSTRNSDPTVILEYENFQITTADLNCLKQKKYINDKIINFYLKFMQKSLLNDDQQRRIHIFDSFFAEALDTMDEARTIRWLRRVNIFEKDYLLIPVNIDEHWFLMVIYHPGNISNTDAPGRKRARILTMDSMPHHAKEKKPQLLQYLYNFIRCALVTQKNMSEEEIGSLHRRMQHIDVDVKEQVSSILLFFIHIDFQTIHFQWISLDEHFFFFLHTFVLEQTNNFDCGIYLLENAENFLKDVFSIDLELEFQLSNARSKRKAMQKLIYKLAEVKMIEDAVMNSKSH